MQFTDTLLTWFEENQRSLPWRGECDPYKIWVSEIILQQTRVQQGWDYYLRFVEAFPSVRHLAEASEEQVLRLWQGLGYYSRARNMHTAAQQIRDLHNSRFPDQYEDIRKLKGIGDYTAAAIGSIAFGLPYPAVDGNVLRIISRIFGICEDIADPATKRTITDICKQHINVRKPGTFNQACMDFGAIQCTPKSPKCGDCPFQQSCFAFGHQLTETLPIKSNKIVKKERHFHYIFYIYNNSTVIEQRTGSDIWKNLYQFPLHESAKTTSKAKPTAEFREVLTHQIINAKFYTKVLKKEPVLTAEQKLVNIEELSKYPMPKIMTLFIDTLDIDRKL